MSHVDPVSDLHHADIAPGDQRLDGAGIAEGLKSYLIGLGLATFLTIVSFFISGTTLVWGPSIPVALVVLAIAQMGVHLVFFLHITTGSDNVNNVMALAFGVLIVLLLLTGSLWIMAHLNHNMAFMNEAMQMETGSGLNVRTVIAKGVVGSNETVPVSAHVSGVIQVLDCDTNTQVKAGQICAKIDPRPYQTVVDRSKADLQTAEAGLEKAKAGLARAKEVFDGQESGAKHPSRKTLDKARKAFEREQTQANREAAKVTELQAALQAAKTNLSDTNIISPSDGKVISRNVKEGQRVTAGSQSPPLFVIAKDPSLVHIESLIAAKDGGEIKPGEKAAITVEALVNQAFQGEVIQVRPASHANENGAAYEVEIKVPNPDLLLKPGMEVVVRIMTDNAVRSLR
jgi:cytochrome o ubiquinol oxidase subunit IV